MARKVRVVKSPRVTVKSMQGGADALARKITAKTNQWKKRIGV